MGSMRDAGAALLLRTEAAAKINWWRRHNLAYVALVA